MKRTVTSEADVKVLHLEITCIGENRVKTNVSSRTSTVSDTLRTYEETQVGLEGITRRSQQLLHTLNQANRHGRLSSRLLQSLKETGQLLRDELLTPRLKERINATDAHHLMICIDEQLVHIPWELLHDGRQFLCQRFAVGRLVQTRQQYPVNRSHRKTGLLQILILADLDDSLPASRKEGAEVRNFFESMTGNVRVMMRSANVNREFLMTKIRSYDWVHFAGHADFGEDPDHQSGWRLTDGWFTAEDAVKMAGTGTMPRLIFANACQSARTAAWSVDSSRQQKLFGLVNALLASGTRHYVGTSWEIPDEPGRCFALAFYRRLTKGATIGRAVLNARQELVRTFGEEQVIWASYVMYGDPTHRYMTDTSPETASSHTSKRMPSHPDVPFAAATRASETQDSRPLPPIINRRLKGRPFFSLWALGAVVLTAAVMISLSSLKEGHDLQAQAAAAFEAGNYEQVLELCPPASAESRPAVSCLLLRGKVLFVQGDLDGARALFRFAKESPRATSMEAAEALIGLGRIASLRGQDQQALTWYQQAAKTAPRRKEPFMALALFHERHGRDVDALRLLDTADQGGPPNDLSLDAMHRSLSAKVALNSDKERIDRIDRLIDQLTVLAEQTPPPGEDTTHRERLPIPVWIMEMAASGYSLQEGASHLMTVLIENRLQNQARFQVLDRHLMASTLSELKLGSSALIDPQTRLRLGWLQAVRIMIDGRIIFAEGETQVTLRCIDTETSHVVAVVVAVYENRLPLSEMARKTADQLIRKLEQVYS